MGYENLTAAQIDAVVVQALQDALYMTKYEEEKDFLRKTLEYFMPPSKYREWLEEANE